MHASFVAGDVKFMASDGQPGAAPDGDDDIALSLATNDAAEASASSTRLLKAATSRCRCGGLLGRKVRLGDRPFGVQWMVSVH